MPYFSTDIDVDVYEFLMECSDSEVKRLIKYLQEDGWLVKENVTTEDSMNILDEEWLTVTNKLNTLRLRLSLEEEESIKEIVNRY